MHVDAVLILGGLVGEIVGEAQHARELVPSLRIEIGVADAGVDRAVPDADIRQEHGTIGAAIAQAVEARHTVVIAGDRLSVDQARTHAERAGGLGNERVTVRPVVPVAGQQAGRRWRRGGPSSGSHRA